MRNGFGSKKLRSPSGDDEEAVNIRNRIAAQTRLLAQGQHVPREEFEAVPPGHSGAYK